METISEIIEKIRNLGMTHQSSYTEEAENQTTKISTFECEKCKDQGYIVVQPKELTDMEWLNTAIKNGYTLQVTTAPCECVEAKRYKSLIEGSGISDAFKSKTVREYKAKNEQQRQARSLAIEYIQNFDEIQKQISNSIAFLGQVGSGKTHLCIAIANALLNQHIGVLYMNYREVISHLIQIKKFDESYQKEINRYKNATVLLIDDLFKCGLWDGQLNTTEAKEIFKIIDHRYFNHLPTLISSEMSIDKMASLDEAIGSRIGEMCKGRIIEFTGKELNHRMVT